MFSAARIFAAAAVACALSAWPVASEPVMRQDGGAETSRAQSGPGTPSPENADASIVKLAPASSWAWLREVIGPDTLQDLLSAHPRARPDPDPILRFGPFREQALDFLTSAAPDSGDRHFDDLGNDFWRHPLKRESRAEEWLPAANGIGPAGATTLTAAGTEDPEDPWIWLEKAEDKEALQWVMARNLKTRLALANDPRFKSLKKQALTTFTAPDRIPYGRHYNGYVYNFWRDKEHVRGVYRRTTLKSYRTANPKWEILLDIDKLAAEEGENWVLSGMTCLPPEYEHCMIALSRGGRDRFVMREWNAAKREFVKDGFKILEAYSNVAWLDRNTLLVSSSRGRSLLSAMLFGYRDNVRKWKRGTPIEDAVPVYEGTLNDLGVMTAVEHRPEGAVSMIARRPDFHSIEYHILKEDGTTVQLPVPLFADLGAVFKGQMLFVLREAWTPQSGGSKGQKIPQGALISFDLNDFLRTGEIRKITTIYVPGERSTIHSLSTTRDVVLLSLLNNVTSEMGILRLKNGEWTRQPAAIPENVTASVLAADNYSNFTMVAFQNYLTPDRLLEFDVTTGKASLLKSQPARFNARGLTVERHEATSKDGTGIPYFYVGPAKPKADGRLPTLLYGYGGFGVSMTPQYLAGIGKLWLERGGALVVANIRGGGEFGPQWHQAALRAKRQHGFDDFIAVADDLVQRRITSPRRLGIMGGSNGGLLVGAAFTQRPKLFNAVVCLVPLLDMIRYVKMPPGHVWVGEYGDPEDPEERAALLRYSPYHNLETDVDYPRVFFLTSTIDDRVNPGHARKMAARMEKMGHDLYFYETTEGGHSASANLSQEADISALQFVYLTRRLMDPNLPQDNVAARENRPAVRGASAEAERGAAGGGQ